MSSVGGDGFTSTRECPSSHDHELSSDPAAQIQLRLTDSEFCVVKLLLLSVYTPTSTGCKPADMLFHRPLAEPPIVGNCITNRALRESLDYEERQALGYDVFEASRKFKLRSNQGPGGLQWHA
jgi:hypothetical protein